MFSYLLNVSEYQALAEKSKYTFDPKRKLNRFSRSTRSIEVVTIATIGVLQQYCNYAHKVSSQGIYVHKTDTDAPRLSLLLQTPLQLLRKCISCCLCWCSSYLENYFSCCQLSCHVSSICPNEEEEEEDSHDESDLEEKDVAGTANVH